MHAIEDFQFRVRVFAPGLVGGRPFCSSRSVGWLLRWACYPSSRGWLLFGNFGSTPGGSCMTSSWQVG